MGLTAENLATQYNISRQEQDELAVMSHQRAIAAIDAGRFEADIIPVPVKVKKAIVEFKVDEHPRRDISMPSSLR